MNTLTTTTNDTKALPQQAPLTRVQKRKNDRLRDEVDTLYSTLTLRFLTYFTNSEDPEGKDVQDKAKQVVAQWRTYCKAKQLIPTLYPAMDNYVDSLFKEYIATKASQAAHVTQPPQQVGVSESPAS